MYGPSVPQHYVPLNRARYMRDDRVIFEQSESDCKEGQSCRVFSKYAIYGFNIIFLVVGTCLLATGAWLRTDSRFRDFLSERYRQVVNEAFWQASTLYTFSYIIIALGACMIIVAMFGCCGATTRSPLFLGFYAFCMFILLVCTISAVSYVIYKKDGIDVELADALNYMVQHYYQGAGVIQESLDHLQQAFRCCGNAGCSDFRAFRQDPPRTCDIRCDGCHYRIWLALRIGFSVALVVFAVVVLAELFAIAIAVTLLFRDEENELSQHEASAHYDNEAKRRYLRDQRPNYYQNSAYQRSQPPVRKKYYPH